MARRRIAPGEGRKRHRTRALGLLALAVLVAVSGEARASEAGDWKVLTAPATRRIDAVLRLGSAIYIDHGDDSAAGRYQRVYLVDGAILLEALPNFLIAPAEHRAGMLPDGLIANGRGMVEAWLDEPTQRYRHGVLGDGFEAIGLEVVDDLNRQFRFKLPDDSVFEDRYPRLADIDGDGRDEAIVVRSYADRGSALAVFKLDAGGLTLAAESEPIGQPQRWLNPVGVADFDGDGVAEIAAVRTPHAGGLLVRYALADGKLVEISRNEDFSNHVVGSRELKMSAIADLNGDGVEDIALPNGTRRVLRLVTFAGGNFAEIASIAHVRTIDSAIHAIDLDGDGAPELVYALDNATVVVLKH